MTFKPLADKAHWLRGKLYSLQLIRAVDKTASSMKSPQTKDATIFMKEFRHCGRIQNAVGVSAFMNLSHEQPSEHGMWSRRCEPLSSLEILRTPREAIGLTPKALPYQNMKDEHCPSVFV